MHEGWHTPIAHDLRISLWALIGKWHGTKPGTYSDIKQALMGAYILKAETEEHFGTKPPGFAGFPVVVGSMFVVCTNAIVLFHVDTFWSFSIIHIPIHKQPA
ncbi:hypothetical protein DRO03_11190 [Methanosarcinales archaeon]|nr:MAG: hypothetical protein DRO03_11190 [Methanosarcinales archaeon]